MNSSDWVHQSPSQPEKPSASALQQLVLTKWRMTRRGKDADQMLQAQVHAPSRVEKWGGNQFDFHGLLVYELLEYI